MNEAAKCRGRRVRCAILVLVAAQMVAGGPWLASPAVGQTAGERRMSEAARRGLADRDFPWYDAEEDRLRRLDVASEEEVAGHRSSRWSGKPAAERAPPSFLTDLVSGIGDVLNVLLWGVLFCLLAGLLYLLVRFLMKREKMWPDEGATGETSAETKQAEAACFDNLPFDIARPQGDLLNEARRCYEQGDYRRAVVYLFSYELVYLDRHQMIHLAKGKTNRQYLRELRWKPPLSELVQRTMIAFEDVFFGDHVLTRGQFEACWNELDRFHEHVEHAVEESTAA